DNAEVEADRAADAMVGGTSFAIAGQSRGLHRKPDGTSHGSTSFPPDMTPVDWKQLVTPTAVPDIPTPITSSLSQLPPLPSGVIRDPRYGNADPHNPIAQSSYDMKVYDARDNMWASFGDTMSSIVSIHNTAIPGITTFNNAEKDPSLKALYEL